MKVEVVEKNIVFDKFFKIVEAKIKFEKFNGMMSEPVTRLNFERGDSVAAIVYNTTSKKASFVNQFKYPCYDKLGDWITEIVAGTIDDNETPEEAIKRELIEEIGYKTDDVEHISTFFVSPGGSSERIYLFLIHIEENQKVQAGGGLISENEDIKLIEFSLDELNSKLKNNEIHDAKTIIAINYLLNKYE